MNIARVLVNLSLDRGFDYLVPESLAGAVRVGCRVSVPFGNSVRAGYVVELPAQPDRPDLQLKSVKSVHEHGGIPENLVRLGEWIADYYCVPGEQAVRAMLPAAVREGKVKEKKLKLYSIAGELAEETFRSAKQRKVASVLLKEGELPLAALTLLADCSAAVVDNLCKKGVLACRETSVTRGIFGDAVLPTSPLPPTQEQQAALDLFDRMGSDPSMPGTMLLFGATNSGKTEVYLQAIARVLAAGKSAIVLVPEISLTPQTVRRFRARFGDDVSVLHSRLSDGERFDQWNRISRGEAKIAVGARSALFAPFSNLGLIVVDEEHESSYKQSETPRYNARDVAVMRGRLEHARVILGSATPSFESYRNALSGKYALARMDNATGGAVRPTVRIVDLKLNPPAADGTPKSPLFSPILTHAVRERVSRAEQTILFLNRRGYARQLMCEACGYVAGCPDCSVTADHPAPMTYHRREALLICHMCGAASPAPSRCPQCGAETIRLSGTGTEKLEAAARAIFPEARIARMDADTTRGANGHERILTSLRRNEIDILIGTQMIAKGLHFPNITLVGVMNADQCLYMPDFRAAERTFDLITQVAGRAGRGDSPGEVIVQTFSPENPTIVMAAQGKFEEFYRFDMEVREMLKYPPFAHLIMVNFRSQDPEKCRRTAEECYAEIAGFATGDAIISPPVPAPVERVRGKFRYQLLVRGGKLKNLRARLRSLVMSRNSKSVEAFIDADPQNIL